MLKWSGAVGRLKILTSVLIALVGVSAQAGTVGQWSGNSANLVWASSGNFRTIYAAATTGTPSHTVESPEAITAQNLANDNFFIIQSSFTSLNGTELNTLVNWIKNGGILLLFATPDGMNSLSLANQILGTLGAGASGNAMSVTNSFTGPGDTRATAGSLIGSDKAVTGPPNNLATQSLSLYQASVIAGGTNLALNQPGTTNLGNALRVDNFSLGKVYVFGERFDSNLLAGTDQNNLRLYLNLLNQGLIGGGGIGGGETAGAPEPATFVLTFSALAGLYFVRRKK